MTDDSKADFENWQPPDHLSAREIISEAEADRLAGRYAEALAKHVWFHQNETLREIRRSSVLRNWVELGTEYPPALQKIKEFRDLAKAKLLSGDGDVDAFAEFTSINRKLDEIQQTVSLFLKLDEQDSELAFKCYPYAESPLIRAGEYQVCGKYIDPEHTLEIELMAWDILRKQPAHTNVPGKFNQKSRFDFRDHGVLDLHTSQHFAAIIALLIHNGRTPEARAFAGRVCYEFNDQVLNELVAEALQGEFPPGY